MCLSGKGRINRSVDLHHCNAKVTHVNSFTGVHYSPRFSGVPRRGCGFKPPLPPKFRNFDKAEPNSQFRGKHIRNDFRMSAALSNLYAYTSRCPSL
jgi:hypothetical protein